MCDNKVNKYDDPYKGPYPITKVCKNGTVTIHQEYVQDHIYIIWIKICYQMVKLVQLLYFKTNYRQEKVSW